MIIPQLVYCYKIFESLYIEEIVEIVQFPSVSYTFPINIASTVLWFWVKGYEGILLSPYLEVSKVLRLLGQQKAMKFNYCKKIIKYYL